MNGRSSPHQFLPQSETNHVRLLRKAFAAHQARELSKAERLYTAVLRQRPNEFDALHMLGLLHYQRGRFPEALRFIGAALKSNGSSADAWSNLGLVFHAQGQHDKALTSYDQALAIRPDHADVLNNRGNTLRDLGQHGAALDCFVKALAIRPQYIAAFYNCGTTLMELGRFEEALATFDAGLSHVPNHPDTLCHRGNALMRLNRLEAAMASYAAAVKFAPNDPLILHNHALALRHCGRPREALASAERSLAIKPDYAPARFEQSMALLALGDLPRGFAAYEARWATAEFAPQRRDFTAPLWRGAENLAGKTLLLHAEQGFGDTLHFVRYAPLLAQQGATIVLEVQPQLKALLSPIDGVSMVLARGEALPPFDLHCPLLSLPLACGTRLDTIPRNVPYLAADPEKTAFWGIRLAAYADKKKIGLVWAGEARKYDANAAAIDARRSVSLAHFAPLADIGNVQFFSLQKGTPATQVQDPPPGLPLVDWTSALVDFGDTAALIANLDLVISVDTAVAHLAGALGTPVWILSRFDACWRWLDRREDSPWYPSARLFHQKGPGAWDDVIVRLRAALAP
jgi:tetratricopeptide (TPR) repeat protein